MGRPLQGMHNRIRVAEREGQRQRQRQRLTSGQRLRYMAMHKIDIHGFLFATQQKVQQLRSCERASTYTTRVNPGNPVEKKTRKKANDIVSPRKKQGQMKNRRIKNDSVSTPPEHSGGKAD